MKKPRLVWLDSLRGVAILSLIVIHYIGAVESRGLVSTDVVEIVKSFFRVATPLFITVFGFTIAYIYYGKVSEPKDLKKLIAWSLNRLPKVLLAREVIVLIYSFSHPEQLNSLVDVLLYKQFSIAGEILTFYFLAIMLTPYVLYFVYNFRKSITLPCFFFIYMSSYLTGINFSAENNSALFRLFFYDIYPFFPFYSCVVVGMYLAILYVELGDDKKRLLFFSILSLSTMLAGVMYLNTVTSSLLHDLSTAYFKSPPHPAYLLIYIGLSILISIAIAFSVSRNFFPAYINHILKVIGKNSLLAYVLHYLLHFTVPITFFIIGKKSTFVEVLVFLFILVTVFYILDRRDYIKTKKLGREVIC